jgi:serine/threonine-protein kinase
MRGVATDRYLPLEHAVHIARQTAAGLAYAHERTDADGRVVRIVHRDVSPTNVLVTYEGQTELVDFGIARAQDELREETGILPGKASYMSPEQVRGETVDHRSDIFALGIILYELTLCQRLYRGPAEAVMKRIVGERVQPPTAVRRDYPAALEQIVMRALEKRPEGRYQSAQEMHDDLEEFLSESGLRSGNRRVAIYMNELFASDGAAGGADAADDAEELDFDRRAPLSMRIEPAAEVPIRPPAAAPIRISSPAVRAQPPAAAVAVTATPELDVSPPGRLGAANADSAGNVDNARPRGSWIVLAGFIVLAIAAMVILTLR